MATGSVLPWIGSRPIAEIDPPELLAALKRIEARGAHETAHRTKERCGQVFRYAIAHGTATRDPSADLRGALAPIVRTSRAAITDPAKVGKLLRDIEGYGGQHVTRCALRLAPLLFVRPGELRAMEWTELDLDAAEWRIPAGKMKSREEHVVLLPAQAVAILRELLPLTERGRCCFPSLRTAAAPMSENTVNAALRSLGYDKDTMTGHGFRAMASTRLNELGWQPDVIERQLAHAERNKVRAAHNRAQYIGRAKGDDAGVGGLPRRPSCALEAYMERSTAIALLLVPIVGPAVRWLFYKPGKMVHAWLWKRLPDGKLRNFLLQKID